VNSSSVVGDCYGKRGRAFDVAHEVAPTGVRGPFRGTFAVLEGGSQLSWRRLSAKQAGFCGIDN